MKVGLIVPGFSADAGDWCIPVLVDVVRELSRRAEVHVFALRYPGRRARYRLHGAQVHALGGGEVRGAGRAGLLTAAWASILTEHRRGPFSVLHGLWADEPGFIAVTAARLLRIPAVVSVMGGELLAMRDIGYGGHLSVSNRMLSAIALRGAAHVTAASAQASGLARRGLRSSRRLRLTRLVWGIDPCLFEPCGPSIELAGAMRVLHVGSLVPIKDQETLLRAVARLRGTEPGVHLHIVGDGPLRAQLTDQARHLGLASSVTFHGQIDRGDLAAYYRGADVVTVSSRYEAQLVVALEAALCGTPIAGTAVGLVADFAPEAALAVPVADDAGLAAAIHAAAQPQTGQALAQTALRLVGSQYLASQTAERLMTLYQVYLDTGHKGVSCAGLLSTATIEPEA
jgi:glycosyltransferase involved in cell wall biosynthesis